MTTISEQMAAWGRRGGQSRSARKQQAARRNVAAARARIGKISQPNPDAAAPAAAPPPATISWPVRPCPVLVAIPPKAEGN